MCLSSKVHFLYLALVKNFNLWGRVKNEIKEKKFKSGSLINQWINFFSIFYVVKCI